ncbi:MAG: hypothetical protein Q9163_002078 [Psora crenata]
MYFLYLLTPLLLALRASSLSIVVPLYIWAGENAAQWTPVLNAVIANPTVHWQVIVNPDNGPGAEPFPDPHYITGIQQLNSYPNVEVIGYVDTTYAKRASADVASEIDKYAGWESYPQNNISVSGIFFDQVSEDGMYDYYQTASAHVKEKLRTVVCNPGTVANEKMFEYCNTIIQFENSYEDWSKFDIATIPDDKRSASAVMIYDLPSDADVGGIVSSMVSGGVGGIYLTGDCCYRVIDAELLQAMASAISSQKKKC